MQSQSKVMLQEDVLSQVVRQQFGTDTTLQRFEELKEGYFNAAYLLELSDGLQCVMKIAPLASVRILTYEKNIMQAEVEAIKLAAEKTEMPVPKIYAYDSSHQYVNSDYYLMEYLSGTPLHKIRESLSTEVQTTIDREAGRLLAQLNTLEGSFFGYWADNNPRFSTWRDAFAAMFKGILQDGEAIEAVIPRPYSELYEKASQYFDVLNEVTIPHLVHWDLWDGNIFVDPQTGRITGIIDFERSLWGDPLMESNFGYVKPESPFIEGYGQVMITTPSQQKRRQLYDLYLFLIMVIESYYRNYVEADITIWARGRLDETLKVLDL